jgi:hypothetical protein
MLSPPKAGAGALPGNRNAANAKVWKAAIERALERRTKSRSDGIKEIDALADTLLTLVASGDLPALKEFGDRMDGKPAQAVELGGTDGGPLQAIVNVSIGSNDQQ